MGFFKSLKETFTGGIDVSVDAPNDVSATDASFSVTVTLVNSGEEPKNIVELQVSLIEEERDRSNDDSFHREHTIATSEKQLNIALEPGATHQETITVPLNAGRFLQQTGDYEDNGAASAALGILGKLQDVSEAFDNTERNHFVKVVADIADKKLSPSKRIPISVHKPGEIGKTFRFGS